LPFVSQVIENKHTDANLAVLYKTLLLRRVCYAHI